jgi:hypothetical protein
LYNGEYFVQQVRWRDLVASFPKDCIQVTGAPTPEALALAHQEGPPYQYGLGCLSDGLLGCWLALVCGVGQVLATEKVVSHLRAVHKYNLRETLASHTNLACLLRAYFAFGDEGGLVVCSWPRGGQLSRPFFYCNEVWTGSEYQVASHLMMMGFADKGLEIVRACRRRYSGLWRNPFNEYEAGHWYARTSSSYSLLQGLSGARYDAVDKKLYLRPSIKGDFRCFISTATGYGTVGVKNGKPLLEVASGTITIAAIDFVAAS